MLLFLFLKNKEKNMVEPQFYKTNTENLTFIDANPENKNIFGRDDNKILYRTWTPTGAINFEKIEDPLPFFSNQKQPNTGSAGNEKTTINHKILIKRPTFGSVGECLNQVVFVDKKEKIGDYEQTISIWDITRINYCLSLQASNITTIGEFFERFAYFGILVRESTGLSPMDQSKIYVPISSTAGTVNLLGDCQTYNLWSDARSGDEIGFILSRRNHPKTYQYTKFKTTTPQGKSFDHPLQLIPYVLQRGSTEPDPKDLKFSNSNETGVFLKIGIFADPDNTSYKQKSQSNEPISSIYQICNKKLVRIFNSPAFPVFF